MSAIQWLERHAPGFADLSADERDLIMHFSLLWSLFEGEVLNGSASVQAIERVVREWEQAGVLTTQMFSVEEAYFRARYYENGAFTYRYHHLHLERSGAPRVVPHVLSGQDATAAEVSAALLIIVFRYRNNLFHGEKWNYELREQRQNFTRANDILMRAIELNRQSQQAPLPLAPGRE